MGRKHIRNCTIVIVPWAPSTAIQTTSFITRELKGNLFDARVAHRTLRLCEKPWRRANLFTIEPNQEILVSEGQRSQFLSCGTAPSSWAFKEAVFPAAKSVRVLWKWRRKNAHYSAPEWILEDNDRSVNTEVGSPRCQGSLSEAYFLAKRVSIMSLIASSIIDLLVISNTASDPTLFC